MTEQNPKERSIRYFSEPVRSMIEYMIFDYNESSSGAFSEMAEKLGVDKSQIHATWSHLGEGSNANRTAAITRAVRLAVRSEEIDSSKIPDFDINDFNESERRVIEGFNSGWSNSEILSNLHINMDDFSRLRSPIFKKLDTKSRFMVVAALAKSKMRNV